MGSFSPSSSDSHAVRALGRSIPSTHSLTSVVLPKPAGAAMRVSLRCRPALSRSSKRGRLTTSGRSGGRYSFVARMDVGMSAYFPYTLKRHPCTRQAGGEERRVLHGSRKLKPITPLLEPGGFHASLLPICLDQIGC